MSLEDILGGKVERIGSNTLVSDLDDKVSRAISGACNLPLKALYLSLKIGSGPKQETEDYIKNYVSTSGLQNTTVRINHTSTWKDVKRLFKDKRLKDIPFVSRILIGVPLTLLSGLYTKITRADYYNPMTRTVTVYSDVPAMALHELGHAKNMQEDPLFKNHVTWYTAASYLPPTKLYQEFRASQNAHRALSESERWQTGRYLVPSFALYVRPLIGLPLIPLMLGAHLIGGIYRLFRKARGNSEKKADNPIRSSLPAS